MTGEIVETRREKKSEKVIGILGGMGPEATLDCFAGIIRNTPAEKDQDHLRVVIDSNPKTPDRTAAVLGRGESPVPCLVDGCRSLELAGADFIIIPCVTVHYFLEELRPLSRLPILSLLDAVADTVAGIRPGLKKLGLLATTGTVRSGIFQRRLAETELKTVTPSDETQALVMSCIYDLKKAQPSRSRTEIKALLASAAGELIEAGAEGIIAGCTEIPLALNRKDLSVPYFDALHILARAAIVRAGRQPRKETT